MKGSIAGRERMDQSRTHTEWDKTSRSIKDEAEDQLGVINGLVQRTQCDGCRPSMRGMVAQLSAMHPAARREAALSLQSARGNRFLQRLAVQAKLTVGQPNDKYEQEADRVANQVMASPEHSAVSGESLCIQRYAGQAGESIDPAVSRIEQVLDSPGRPLEPKIRQDMEQRFGREISEVRIHTDARATESARALNAQAYTVGHNVMFGMGRYAPETAEGRRLLAHELTHVIQQGHTVSQPAAGVIQRWGTEEHRQLGERAVSGQGTDIDIGGGTTLTYGELVGLAADYFESIEEMRRLAGTPAGQEQLRWARWWALKIGSEPSVSNEAKAAVRDRYYRLAANNLAHFQAGGHARNAYERMHIQALTSAFLSGIVPHEAGRWQEAVTTEAFSNHYLTDMFAAGHIRTPRPDIKAWYTSHFPNSVDRFINYTANWIALELDRLGETRGIPNSWVASNLSGRIRALGGSAIASFSIGDIVSIGVHNLDNRTGLNVVSQVNASGQAVPGGFQWQAGGEGRIQESAITQQMAISAIRASFADLIAIRTAGQQAYQGFPIPLDDIDRAFTQALAQLRPFIALRYVPSEGRENRQIASGTSSRPGEINWRWGSIDPVLRTELDNSVRHEIAGTLRSKAGEVPTEATIAGVYTIRQIRTAFLAFCTHLESTGFVALETAMGTPASPPPAAPTTSPSRMPDAGMPGGSSGPRDAGVPLPAGL